MCAKLCQVNSGAYAIGLISWASKPTVTKQYKFGTGVSWEGNCRSGVALDMRHLCLSTYTGSTAKDREMRSRAYDPSERGTIYLYLSVTSIMTTYDVTSNDSRKQPPRVCGCVSRCSGCMHHCSRMLAMRGLRQTNLRY